jgi:hypothetical protein
MTPISEIKKKKLTPKSQQIMDKETPHEAADMLYILVTGANR